MLLVWCLVVASVRYGGWPQTPLKLDRERYGCGVCRQQARDHGCAAPRCNVECVPCFCELIGEVVRRYTSTSSGKRLYTTEKKQITQDQV